jgi:hypothetical protein
MTKKSPKKKLINKIGPLEIWSVNGPIIRKNVDPEFTNFGQHWRFKFIPENELWIDDGDSNEINFFITHLLIERKFMSQGLSYEEALELADRAERADRFKSKKFKKAPKDYSKQVKKIKVKKIAAFEDVDVWVVDGELVRDLFYIDFTEGGHDLVYNFIPEGEVWIDDDVVKGERLYIMLHELIERRLMEKEKNYQDAHNKATKIEWLIRSTND